MKEEKKYRVLIVDDESSNILELTQILSSDYIVYAEKNEQNAVAIAEKLLPDVILLDILMPQMDGYDIITALKSSEKTKDIPVIFITGLRDADAEEKGLALGAADYIIKPFSHAVVKFRVKNQIKILEQRATEYDLMKYRLTGNALKAAMWDMTVAVEDDPVSTENKITWSPEFCCMLGFSDESDFPDTFEAFAERLHPEDVKSAIAAFRAHLNDRSGETAYNTEYRLMLKNGEYRHFHAFGDTLRSKNGTPRKFVGAIVDITEKKQLAKERAEAEIASRAKSSFLANMSHEIRTPMNTIIGVTEILLREKNVPEEIGDGLNRIHTACNLLLGIINDILDFSKIEAGKMDIIPAEYDIPSLINDTVHMNMMRIESKPITFKLQADENIPSKMIGDELRIKQILNNLLSNAFKYTDAGEVVLSVASEPCDEGVVLVLNVQDTGHGMTKEQLERLFDQYSRFNQEAKRTTEGTGLGLSITQNLIGLMGGTIYVESELGKGSLFTVRLPQEAVDTEVIGIEVADNLQKFRYNYLENKKRSKITYDLMPYGSVLIVDDVEANLYVAIGLMKLYKLKIDAVMSGRDAIDRIKNGNVYDVVFMDHMMPEMDGIETTKHLRNLGYKGPIVALTANALAGQMDMFLNNGFDAFIAKPIDTRQLDSILNKLVRDKRQLESTKAALSLNNQAAMYLSNKKIDGLDIEKGMKKFGNDENIYLKVLRKYAAGNRSLLGSLEAVNKGNVSEYEISVHGIRGSSFDIFANQIGEKAAGLEAAAKAGDFDYINEHNPGFLETAWKLVNDIEDMLKNIDEQNPKPKKDRPDAAVLSKLLAACEVYSMTEVDEAIAEIDAYQYEADDGLVDWLLEKVDVMQFAEIVNKLSGLMKK